MLLVLLLLGVQVLLLLVLLLLLLLQNDVLLEKCVRQGQGWEPWLMSPAAAATSAGERRALRQPALLPPGFPGLSPPWAGPAAAAVAVAAVAGAGGAGGVGGDGEGPGGGGGGGRVGLVGVHGVQVREVRRCWPCRCASSSRCGAGWRAQRGPSPSPQGACAPGPASRPPPAALLLVLAPWGPLALLLPLPAAAISKECSSGRSTSGCCSRLSTGTPERASASSSG